MIDISFQPRRPRIDYGPTLAQSWTAEIPARLWVEQPRSVGQRRISAGGYGASHVIRNDVILRCRFRIRESDWPTFYRAIQWGHLQERCEFYPDADDTDTSFAVYVDEPSAGSEIRPQRSGEYPRVFEFPVSLRLADIEDSFALQYHDQLSPLDLVSDATTGGTGGLDVLPLVVPDPGALPGSGAVAEGEPSPAGSGSSGSSGDSTPPGGPTTPDEPDDPYTPDPGAANNEPAGFIQVFNKPHDAAAVLTEYDFTDGNAEFDTGDLLITYPTGRAGGSAPGQVTLENTNHGPYVYYRFEGVLMSAGWQGHGSAINKLWYHRLRGHPSGATCPFIARGSNTSNLYPSMANQGWHMVSVYGDQVNFTWEGCRPFTGPGGVVWNDLFPNYATPTEAQARMTRGTRHTVEELFYVGTGGNADGWFKTWLNGVLVMDYRDLYIVEPGDTRAFFGINIDPVWGGTGDEIAATQTLRIARFYASEGSSL